MRILFVVIADFDVRPSICSADEVAHVYSRQLKQGMDEIDVEVDLFPVAGRYSAWNYLRAAITMFRLSISGGLDKYDLIHAHYGFNGWVARCQVRKPVVLTFMGSDVYRFLERQLARVLARLVSAVIVPGAQMKGLLGSVQVDVIPAGIDLETFTPMDKAAMRTKHDLPNGINLVLFPYDPARVRVKRPDIVEAAVAQIDGAEMVIVYGRTPAVVAEYMNACDVLAMASSHEGAPAAPREALACNLPVVSVDVGDIVEHISGVVGCYVCERTPDDMSAKLRQVFTAGRRLENGRDRVLHWGLKAAAVRNVEVYTRVLQTREDGGSIA